MPCVFAKKIYTGRTVIENGYVAFNGRMLSGVSRRPQGEVLGKFAVITPALIDPHSHIGMCRWGEPGAEDEANDISEAVVPINDALDSVQMDDHAFTDAVEMGVLYSCVVPGSGNIIGGLSAVIRNWGKNTSDAFVARAGVKAAFGFNPMSVREWKGRRPSTRMGALGILRAKLDAVEQKLRQYQKARGAKKRDITFTTEEDIFRDLLTGRQVLRVHVHKIDDIAALLRFTERYKKLRITVEHACDVHRPDIYRELARRKIPVTFGPADAFAYKVELKHENWRNVRLLIESGVHFGLMSDHPVTLSRGLLLQTRWFIRCGLSKQEAIEVVTRCNAEILGVDKHLGTLQRGKWASLVGWNGDPFDLTCYPQAVFGEGELLYRE
ncbi:MAG: amidohydrolase family protein [Sedimentisphaerales bacterium]|nr:amidohydrolase family protein [Sedimentisphaerales bacterium]